MPIVQIVQNISDFGHKTKAVYFITF
ncbi:MAG: hypothetical protein ACD_66C00245G0001, partial [uncultured bacterium]